MVRTDALDKFTWNREEAEVYLEADAKEEAVWVWRGALYEAIYQGRDEEISYFRGRLTELNENPDDLREFEE